MVVRSDKLGKGLMVILHSWKIFLGTATFVAKVAEVVAFHESKFNPMPLSRVTYLIINGIISKELFGSLI